VFRFVLLSILISLLVRFFLRLGELAIAAFHAGSAPTASSRPAVPLVACRRCGVFVPQAAAASGSGGFLCRACAGAGG